MKCFSNELIQHYIDGEISEKQALNIENHIIECRSCANKIAQQRSLSIELKNSINILSTGIVEIPTFTPQSIPTKKQYYLTKKIIYALSAACVLAFLFFRTPKTKNTQNDALIIYQIDMDFDANKPITDQDFIINIVDPEGNVSEFNF
jgi:predicted anti-sigma-YlaC factor YlaD